MFSFKCRLGFGLNHVLTKYDFDKQAVISAALHQLL